MADILNPDGSAIDPSSGMVGQMQMQVQLQAIDRQRKIAEILQQDSLTPQQGQMISGHYVAPSAMQYISKLAQGLMGTNRQSALDKQQMGLAKNYDSNTWRIAQMLSGQSQSDAGTPTSQTPTQSPAPAQPSGIGQPLTSSQTTNAAPPQAEPPPMQLGSGMFGLNSQSIANTAAAGDPVGKAVLAASLSAPTSPSLTDPNTVWTQGTGRQGLDLSKLTPAQQVALAKSDPKAFATGVADFQQTQPVADPAQSPTQSAAPVAQPAPVQRSAGAKSPFAGMSPILIQQILAQPGGMAKLAQIQADVYAKNTEDTPEMKNLAAAYGKNSPQYQQGLQAVAAKSGYIAPESVRPGAWALDPLTRKPFFNAPDQHGIQYTMPDANGNITAGTPKGFNAAKAGTAAAVQEGVNSVTPAAPGSSPYNIADGTFKPRTVKQIVEQADGQGSQAQGLGMPVGLAAGADTAANNKLNVMKDNFTTLSNQNSNAQTTISRLQTIKDLGAKAITGGENERRDYLNTLLSLAGMPSATDAKTASDLIDKNASQISTSLGMGPQGSDALRAMLGAAYPNRHMTQAAMSQAVDALAPSLQMTQAKTALLTPHFNANDPVSYQVKQQIFDTNADPKLWQYKNLGPGTPQGKAFLQAAQKMDPAFINKANALHQIGAY